MLVIRQIETPVDCAAVKALVIEFVTWANELAGDPEAGRLTFKGLEAELDGLPGIYGPPTGCFLLARRDGLPAGCVALRETDASTAELKRMYVRPDQRGQGVGQRLVEEVLAQARAQGRQRVILDSWHSMTGAHRIYRALGFRDIPTPEGFPADLQGKVIFMEMTLD